jgi:predicted RNase H-like nuclease (RuvC/YqgF family)
MQTILLEWLSTLFTAGDDLVKVVVGFLTLVFGGSKVYDFIQKIKEGNNKLEETRINADKEIKNNQDKHRAELEKLQSTITHNESEIRYKDDIIKDCKNKVDEKGRKIDELVRINDRKDEEIIKLHERLLKCSENK